MITDISGYGKSSDGGLFTGTILRKSLEANTINIPNSKPPSKSGRTLALPSIERRSITPWEIFATTLSKIFSPERWDQANLKLQTVKGTLDVQDTYSILTQIFRLFYGIIQLISENAEKVVLAASVLHSYLGSDLSVEDCAIESTDAPWQFSYIIISGGSASEEAMSVREKYREYFENVGSVPWELETIGRGRKVSK